MSRILVTITAYNRPQMLRRLLSQIEDRAKGYEVFAFIADDASDNMDHLPEIAEEFPWATVDLGVEHCGKEHYWELIDLCMGYAGVHDWDYWLHLPDDVTISTEIFDKCIALYQPGSVLNPLKVKRKLPRGQFTNKRPRVMSNGLIWTEWVDCCWFSDRHMGEALNWQIDPVDPGRWFLDPTLGSGVGSQMSNRLEIARVPMFQVQKTLVFHGDHDSLMNPKRKEPLVA